MNRSQSAKGLKGVCAGLAALIVLAAVPVFAQKVPFCVTNPQYCQPVQRNPTTFTVTNTNDSGPGSLRDAITNATVPGDTVNFGLPLPATIVVSTTLTLPPGVNVTISGPGSLMLTIAGVAPCNPASCVRTPENNQGDGIAGPVFTVNGTVTISGVTISGGNGTSDGGGISNYGTLTLDSVEVSGNRVCDRRWSNGPPCASLVRGGGIFNTGTLTLINSTVSRNSVWTSISSPSDDSTRGGGIYNYGLPQVSPGILTVINSTVSDNLINQSALGLGYFWGRGGGIFNDTGTVTLTNSTVSRNAATKGGGIFNNYLGGLKATNSTIAGNYTFSGGGGYGGGIYIDAQNSMQGWVSLTFSTVAYNHCAFDTTSFPIPCGGGIYSAPDPSIDPKDPNSRTDLFVMNSIVANNIGGAIGDNGGANCFLGRGQAGPSLLGHNLSDDYSCFTFADMSNTPAGLDPAGLKNNGGPTETVALLPGSPAVDAIPLNACVDASGGPFTTDQRGVSRPQGAGCDIGAFEYWQKPIRPFDPGSLLLR